MGKNNDTVIHAARLSWVDRNLKVFQENLNAGAEGQMDRNEVLSSLTTQNIDSRH